MHVHNILLWYKQEGLSKQDESEKMDAIIRASFANEVNESAKPYYTVLDGMIVKVIPVSETLEDDEDYFMMDDNKVEHNEVEHNEVEHNEVAPENENNLSVSIKVRIVHHHNDGADYEGFYDEIGEGVDYYELGEGVDYYEIGADEIVDEIIDDKNGNNRIGDDDTMGDELKIMRNERSNFYFEEAQHQNIKPENAKRGEAYPNLFLVFGAPIVVAFLNARMLII